MTHTQHKLLVFTPIQSERLTYCLDFVFKAKGIPYQMTNKPSEFSSVSSLKLNYSNSDLDAHLTIQPSGLLSETDINDKHEVSFNQNEWLINGINDDFSFIFYTLSRYEEYLITQRDTMDRFEAKSSILFKHKQLTHPSCDLLVKRIYQKLGLDYSPILKQFTVKPSFDIDVAWAYKHKGIYRNVLGSLQSITKGQFPIERLKVLLNKTKDPFDTYHTIEKTLKTHESILFFLLGDWGKYDKNIQWQHTHLKQLIKRFVQKAAIGIHPSYAAYLNKNQVAIEVDRLAKNSDINIYKSRQHFLRLRLPETYQILIDLGITEDYSMGYADHYGFRAGTAFPFFFFDLSQNRATHLKVFPITYMDGTLKQYLKLSPNESIDIIHQLKKTVQSVGGHFIPLWHNHSISNHGEWKDWLRVYEANFTSQSSEQ